MTDTKQEMFPNKNKTTPKESSLLSEQILERLDRLEKENETLRRVANQSRLSIIERNNEKEQGERVSLNLFEGEVITKWKMVRDSWS